MLIIFAKIRKCIDVCALQEITDISKFFRASGGIRPLISYVPFICLPQVSITWQSDEENSLTLNSMLNYFESSQTAILVAIDELQRIREFRDVNMEAKLIMFIQPLGNVCFIFIVSSMHVISGIFMDMVCGISDVCLLKYWRNVLNVSILW